MSVASLAGLIVLGLLGAGTVFAHTVGPEAGTGSDGSAVGLSSLGVEVPLALTALLYALGAWRLLRRSATGRRSVLVRALLFTLGWVALAAALLSPLDTLSGELFSIHMTQHEVLMLLAAPLLVLGKPLPAFLWALPHGWRAAVASAVQARWIATGWTASTRPLTGWFAHAIALWVWHTPRFFQAALVNRGVHDLQHLSFLGAALLFWSALFHERTREGQGAAILYLFTTTIHSSVLGALITFAQHPWFPAYLHTTWEWGFTPLEDQQLGGLIMWVPGCLVYVGFGLLLLARWISMPVPRQPA